MMYEERESVCAPVTKGKVGIMWGLVWLERTQQLTYLYTCENQVGRIMGKVILFNGLIIES